MEMLIVAVCVASLVNCVGIVALLVLEVTTHAKTMQLLGNAERLLRMSETHAAVTDDRKDRMVQVVHAATAEVKRTVESLPEKAAVATVEKLKQGGDDSRHDLPRPPGV